ncbi:MAG: discoidin domain-containing protein, partial [Candidatus Omnitrophota bacterium]
MFQKTRKTRLNKAGFVRKGRNLNEALKKSSLVLFFCLSAIPAFAQSALTISQATASSTYSSYAASRTIDNSLSTYWRGASSQSYYWLSLDLGSSTSLSQISIYWNYTRGSSNYNIQGSNNNSTWTNLYTGLSSLGGSSNP